MWWNGDPVPDTLGESPCVKVARDAFWEWGREKGTGKVKI